MKKWLKADGILIYFVSLQHTNNDTEWHNVVPSVTSYREEGKAGYYRVFVAERSDKEEGRE